MPSYRGRIAPSPTGFLHLGHARTFWVAHQRARAAGGKLVFRNEDLDLHRCKPQFAAAMYEDLRWLGLDWDEGPDVGGLFGPYLQSQRRGFYFAAWQKLRSGGFIYPCACSRKDLERALQAPHEDDDEAPYPGTCREKISTASDWKLPAGVSWRFKVPDGQAVAFADCYLGHKEFVAGRDFADFLVWRRDDVPAYQLAVVVDDVAMQITEVVRGEDLAKSTARQLLLLEALRCPAPDYFHCPLLRDAKNQRLAKRHDALSLRTLRQQGTDPKKLRERFAAEIDWSRGMRARL
jgi:glutamyl/glutaminyl-tRNA synthetase